jgi:hypothetical protein
MKRLMCHGPMVTIRMLLGLTAVKQPHGTLYVKCNPEIAILIVQYVIIFGDVCHKFISHELAPHVFPELALSNIELAWYN